MKEDSARDVTVVHFTGSKMSLDEATLHRIYDQLLALADEPSASDVLLDFGAVDYISGMALGTLVSLHQKLRARGRHLTIDNLRPQVHKIFAVTRLDKFLNLRLAGQVVEPVVEVGRSPRRRKDRWIEIPLHGV